MGMVLKTSCWSIYQDQYVDMCNNYSLCHHLETDGFIEKAYLSMKS